MRKLKEKFLTLKKVEENISTLKNMLSDSETTKKEILDKCEHDLVLTFAKNSFGDLVLFKGSCLLCGKELDYTVDNYLYSFGNNEVLKEKVNPTNIIDITSVVNRESLLFDYSNNNYCCVIKALEVFERLMKDNRNFNKEDIKINIYLDALNNKQTLCSEGVKRKIK